MTLPDLIRKIIDAVINENVRFSIHALEQMNERGLVYQDVVQIARSCIHFKWQEEKQTYLILGYALNGKGAAFACKLDHGIVIITVMWRHLSKKEREKI
ncbi:MAG: DUF4258 domain-containing protein [Nitrospirae bacterium]|nr:DUF4258 domain-containing protein [Nitrospirota bacterium]MBI3352834.1 DUF4258 domain-containing protein [Nitrospirota bacterium]